MMSVPTSVESQCSSGDISSKLSVHIADLTVPAEAGLAVLPSSLILSVWKVCRELMPDWSSIGPADAIPSKIAVRQISGGITNMLFLVSIDSAALRPNRVLARVFGAKTELLINREKDNAIFHFLSDANVGPKYWGRFGNGRLEGFFDARPLEPTEMGHSDVVPWLGPCILRMHELHPLPAADAPEWKLPESTYEPSMWITMDLWLQLAEEVKFDASVLPDVKKASTIAKILSGAGVPGCREQLNWLRTVIPSPQNGHGRDLVAGCGGVETPQGRAWALLSTRVFSHNDLLGANILVQQEEDEKSPDAIDNGAIRLQGGKVVGAQLIDFEYGWFSYLGHDLANHFCEYAGFDFAACLDRDYPVGLKKLPTVRCYCDAAFKSSSSPDASSLVKELAALLPRDDAEYAALCDALDKFALAPSAFWGLWSVLQAKHSPIDFDFAQYAVDRWWGFETHRRAFFGESVAPAAAAGGGGEI